MAAALQLVTEANEHRLILDKIGARLNELRESGWVVAGELDLHAECLAQNEAFLSELQVIRAGNRLTQDAVERLRALLPDAGRSLVNELHKMVSDLGQHLDKKRVQVQGQAVSAYSQLDKLKQDFDDAVRAGAPSLHAHRELRVLDDLVRQAETALRERRIIEAESLLERFRKQTEGQTRKVLDDLQKQADTARPLRLRSELLLLRTPPDAEGWIQYTILLRTPSEPGMQGVSVQATSSVIDSDRRDILNQLKRLYRLPDGSGSRKAPAPKSSELLSAPAEGSAELQTEGSAALQAVEELNRDALGRRIGRLSGVEARRLARDLGDFMYKLFIPEAIQQLLSDTSCSLTITSNDLEVPWELMRIQSGKAEQELLCLERPVSRMPLGRAVPRRDRAVVSERKQLRFLLIQSLAGKPLPAAETEIDLLRQSLQREWKDRITIEVLRGEDASGARLNRILREGRYDVIHYAGHAQFDESQPDRSGLILYNNEPFSAEKIRRFLTGRPLVFLNACETGRVQNEQESHTASFQGPAEGLASAFIYGGALACIGSQAPVDDRQAANFAHRFYDDVLHGHMLGEAMWRARQESFASSAEDVAWTAFVLYGDPTFRITY